MADRTLIIRLMGVFGSNDKSRPTMIVVVIFAATLNTLDEILQDLRPGPATKILFVLLPSRFRHVQRGGRWLSVVLRVGLSASLVYQMINAKTTI